MKVYSVNSQLFNVTGVQRVLMDIHHAVQGEYEAKIVGNIPFEKVHKGHAIKLEEYINFSNPFMFYDSIVVVHERRLLLLFWILNHLFFQRIKIVYVHHSLLHGHKMTTVLPKTIVAIADRGVENLIHYFGVPMQHIHKIHNCVVDSYKEPHPPAHKERISLLLPGRINSFKQQFEIVNHLKGKLDKRIVIKFAGDGDRLEELRNLCEGDDNFEVLGFRNDVIKLLGDTDYIFLFSKQEGLSITLIEATMVGMPIICSDVGGNPEICRNGENGWVLNNWDELIRTLNNLPNVTDEQYKSMCEKSRDIYSKNFTFEIFKQKYLELLAKL